MLSAKAFLYTASVIGALGTGYDAYRDEVKTFLRERFNIMSSETKRLDTDLETFMKSDGEALIYATASWNTQHQEIEERIAALERQQRVKVLRVDMTAFDRIDELRYVLAKHGLPVDVVPTVYELKNGTVRRLNDYNDGKIVRPDG